MSTNSGLKGDCATCRHVMNIHQKSKCAARRCRFNWLRCTVPGDCNGVYYRVCKQCPNHPAAWPEGWEATSNQDPDENKEQLLDDEEPEPEKTPQKNKAPQKRYWH